MHEPNHDRLVESILQHQLRPRGRRERTPHSLLEVLQRRIFGDTVRHEFARQQGTVVLLSSSAS